MMLTAVSQTFPYGWASIHLLPDTAKVNTMERITWNMYECISQVIGTIRCYGGASA